MKKIISYTLLILIAFFSFFQNSFAIPGINNDNTNRILNIDYGKCPNGTCSLEEGIKATEGKIIGTRTDGNVPEYVSDIVKYVLGFLFFITVVIFIWAGVTILISSGDENKVEKAKKIMIYAVFGLVVIFLAYPIAQFIIDSVFEASTGKNLNP